LIVQSLAAQFTPSWGDGILATRSLSAFGWVGGRNSWIISVQGQIQKAVLVETMHLLEWNYCLSMGRIGPTLDINTRSN